MYYKATQKPEWPYLFFVGKQRAVGSLLFFNILANADFITTELKQLTIGTVYGHSHKLFISP